MFDKSLQRLLQALSSDTQVFISAIEPTIIKSKRKPPNNQRNQVDLDGF